MYDETKLAIKKAFEIGNLLFSLDIETYNSLLKNTNAIEFPQDNPDSSIKEFIEKLKTQYIAAARKTGLPDKYGIAMMQYVALLEEMENE